MSNNIRNDDDIVEITADIEGIRYEPYLCKDLRIYDIDDIGDALQQKPTFLLNVGKKTIIAVSWWVSPKRTRSYPYARVYDSLAFPGKKATIIPVFKDEGADGGRDFLQWDTISLMSLLGVYVIVSYYTSAKKNPRYNNKITNQRFDIDHIKMEIHELLNYHSDALHWNLERLDKIDEIGRKALKAYNQIAKDLNVKMHSAEEAYKRITELFNNKQKFREFSRELAKKAQHRERVTIQPKEYLRGRKASLTIKNYLGGYYYFTCDEVVIEHDKVYLIESKHTKQGILPSLDDIKDGLLKMILYTNLKNVTINNKSYNHIPMLRLTTSITNESLVQNKKYKEIINKLRDEANRNGFKIQLNETIL